MVYDKKFHKVTSHEGAVPILTTNVICPSETVPSLTKPYKESTYILSNVELNRMLTELPLSTNMRFSPFQDTTALMTNASQWSNVHPHIVLEDGDGSNSVHFLGLVVNVVGYGCIFPSLM